MEVDAVVAPKIWADQAPCIKAAAGDGDQNGFSRGFGQLAPTFTLQLDRSTRGIIWKNVIHGDDGAGIFLLGYVHHLRINLVALFFRFKLNIEDKVLVRRDHNGRGIEVAVSLERVLGFMKKFIGQGLEIGHKQVASCCSKSLMVSRRRMRRARFPSTRTSAARGREL